jgi:hypothetical protein
MTNHLDRHHCLLSSCLSSYFVPSETSLIFLSTPLTYTVHTRHPSFPLINMSNIDGSCLCGNIKLSIPKGKTLVLCRECSSCPRPKVLLDSWPDTHTSRRLPQLSKDQRHSVSQTPSLTANAQRLTLPLVRLGTTWLIRRRCSSPGRLASLRTWGRVEIRHTAISAESAARKCP